MSEPLEFTASVAFDRNQLEPFAVGQVQWLRRFGDGGRAQTAAGYWVATPADAPEAFEVVGEGDETIVLLEGRVEIQLEDGETLDLRAGSSASFNSGTRTRWTILEPIVEFFQYS